MDKICTFFTSAKPFNDKTKIAQYNSLRNWAALGQNIILMGDDEGVEAAARLVGAQYVPDIEKTSLGTPLLSDMFAKAQEMATTPFVCFINADILLPPSFLDALKAASNKWERFLMVGQRWDLDVEEELCFETAWPDHLELLRHKRGKLHSPWGLDYFAFPRGVVRSMPPFAIGRPHWDSWLIYSQAANGTPLLNATRGVRALHQNHGYGHVPKGRQNTYSGPEGDANGRLLRENASDLNELYASTFRAEWCFDGSAIRFDDSWARWWWFTRPMFALPRLVRDILRGIIGEQLYARLKRAVKK